MLTLTFHGHACFLIEADDRRILIDPFLTGNPAADIGPDKLPKIDAVLLSHGHGDHLGDAVAIATKHGATVVATYELAQFCNDQGATVHSMHIGGAHRFPWGTVKLVPAFHGGARAPEARRPPQPPLRLPRMPAADPLPPPDVSAARPLGPSPGDVRAMLETVGYASLDAFTEAVVPADIRLRHPLDLPPARTEQEALAELRRLAAQNQAFRSHICMGYHDFIKPPVILRHLLE